MRETPSVQQALHALICAYDAAPLPQITALIAAVRAEDTRWYHAVDQIAVTQDMAVNIDDPDPYARLLEIVSWNAEVACDPAVSAKARELIEQGRAEGAAQIEPHDCEAWAMEGIGCANCNPASPQAWQARAETAEAKLTEAGHRTLEQGERLIEWRNRAEAAEAECQRLREQLSRATP